VIWVLLIAAAWSALFLYAAREEIADAWRTYHQRAARRAALKSPRGTA
jgi:hypothetical protein